MDILLKAIYIIFKNLVKEIKTAKPNYMKYLQDCFIQRDHVFKNIFVFAISKVKEFCSLLENSTEEDIKVIEQISLYINENLLSFSLKMLNLEVVVTQKKTTFDAENYINHMEYLQRIGFF